MYTTMNLVSLSTAGALGARKMKAPAGACVLPRGCQNISSLALPLLGFFRATFPHAQYQSHG